MSTSFKVLPSNYVGVSGSTMPVRAELQGGEVQGCPIGETWQDIGGDGEEFVLDTTYGSTQGSVTGGTSLLLGYNSQAYIPRFQDSSISHNSFKAVYRGDSETRLIIGDFTIFELYIQPTYIRYYAGGNQYIYGDFVGKNIEVVFTRGDVGERDTFTLFCEGVLPRTEFEVNVMAGANAYRDVKISTGGGNYAELYSIEFVGLGYPSQCQGELETYNLELFDNLGVSRDTQVVTGGEVQGCPIGETFYEGGTSEYPFDLSDWSGGSIDGGALVAPSGGVVLLYDATGNECSFKSKFRATTAGVGTEFRVRYGAGYLFGLTASSTGTQTKWQVSVGGVVVYTPAIRYPHGNYTLDVDCKCVYSVDRWMVSFHVVVGGVYSDDIKMDNVEFIIPSGELARFTYSARPSMGGNVYVDDLKVVGLGLPNQCTGETTSKAEYIYDAENMQAVDTGEWKLVADGAVEAPFQVAIVTEGANTITQGDTTVEVITLDGSGVDIALDMERGVDSRGFVQWLDNGKEYDNYKNSFFVRSETPQSFELLMNSDSVDSVEISTPIKEGFFPFGMGFATEQNYPVNINTWEIEAQTYHGEVKDYSVTAYPNVRDIYSSLIESTTLSGCVLDHWQIAGVPFPFMQPDNDHNDMRFTSVGHGDSYQVVDPTREYGESASFTIEVEEEQARLILQFFTKVMRGTEQTATFPASYNLFSRRYEGLTTATVKLFSNVVKVLHISQGRVEINFSLQIVGV
ncbi:MAG: hypothetical protein GY799_04500 [Desulfobulbaceae bacterium]|nr:hypothetical protein [Desulfobulbaceae bacterium]